LSVFNGQSIAGDWILRVKDNGIGAGGNLTGFALELCSSISLNPPIIVNNSPLSVASGLNELITTALLKTEDADDPPSALYYTVMALPQKGQLVINGINAEVGTVFLQTIIDEGLVRYYDYGLNQGADNFTFCVSDRDGGLVTGVYVISPLVNVKNTASIGQDFDLTPNPAASNTLLSFERSLEYDAQVVVYNLAGQALKQWQVGSGQRQLNMDLAGLPKGVYAVSVENERGKGVKRLVVQ
jgi:hypothetical protein